MTRVGRRIALAAAIVAIALIASAAVSIVVTRTPTRDGCGGLGEWIEAELAGEWSGHDGVNPVLLSFAGSSGVCAWSADGVIEVCDVTMQEAHLSGAELLLTGSAMGNLSLIARLDDEYERLALFSRVCVLPWRSTLVLKRGIDDRSSFEQLLDAVHLRTRDRTASATGPR